MKKYLKNTWEALWTIFIGMKVTWKHLFIPAVTIQYPDEHRPIPDRARNRLYVNIDDCIGCMQCQRACPVDCIDIKTVKATPEDDLGLTSKGTKKALWVTQFNIDFAKCMYCQLCVFPCPTECINMTKVYEFSEFERENLLYNFSGLSLSEIKEKEENYKTFMEKKAAEKAAKAKAAAEAKAKQDAENNDNKPSSEENKS
jgi:NADH-quinone oxidoreductase subunit I